MTVGLEPTQECPSGFLVHRLNHSAMSPYKGNTLHSLPCPDTSTYPIPSQTASHIDTFIAFIG